MKTRCFFLAVLILAMAFPVSAARKNVHLLTLEWEPYVGDVV